MFLKADDTTIDYAKLLGAGDTTMEWNYGYGENGIENWPGYCNKGTRQSPIDIRVDRDVSHRPDGVCPFVFFGYNTKPIKFEIQNTGNSIQFTKHLEEKETHPYITGGGLPKNEEFEFVQGHFHWNGVDDAGAEHHVDNYPDRASLELHLMFL